MINGTLKYTCEVGGYIFRSFEQLEVCVPKPWVEKVVLTCKNETPIEVTVTFVDVPSADTAYISGKEICRTIVARLALKYGLCIQDPMLMTQVLEEDGETVGAAGAVPMGIAGKDSKTVESLELLGLKAELEELRTHRDVYEDLYRVAMQSVDNVDRYMSLYRVLSILITNAQGKETQNSVDEFIEKVTNEKRRYKRSDKSNTLETMYTKLRNEISHVRSNVDLADTRRNMDVWVYELAGVVKKAIETMT